MLADVAEALRCPVCEMVLGGPSGAALTCPQGHSFDISREGYASLLTGAAATTGDSAAMIAARDRFLGAGHFLPIVIGLAELAIASVAPRGIVLDLGAGTGYHLAHVLDALPGRAGAALDVSKPALRRAARAHPRIEAFAVDTWRALPFHDRSAALVLNVFAPRNPGEIARVLDPGGALLTVTPTPRHAHELVAALGLLSVPEDKPERLAASLGPALLPDHEEAVEERLRLGHEDVLDLVRMGPSAYHVDDSELAGAVARLPEPVAVTSSVALTRFRPAAALR
jgi:23S rRNA (guanine745-N1)-methyltransferase